MYEFCHVQLKSSPLKVKKRRVWFDRLCLTWKQYRLLLARNKISNLKCFSDSWKRGYTEQPWFTQTAWSVWLMGLYGINARGFIVPSKYKHLDSLEFIFLTDKREHKQNFKYMPFLLLHSHFLPNFQQAFLLDKWRNLTLVHMWEGQRFYSHKGKRKLVGDKVI